MLSVEVNCEIAVECGDKGDNLQRRLVSTPATCRGQCHPSCSKTNRPPVVFVGQSRHCGRSPHLAIHSASLTTALSNDLVLNCCTTKSLKPTALNCKNLGNLSLIDYQQCKRPKRTISIRPCNSLFRPVFVGLTTHLLIILFFQVLTTSFYAKQAGALPIGQECFSDEDLKLAHTSTAAKVLWRLKCEFKTNYWNFINTHYKGIEPSPNSNRSPIAKKFRKLYQSIDEFAQKGMRVLYERNRCVSETFEQLAKLRPQGENNELLEIAHDIIAIELHQSCINQSLRKMPKVPDLIEEVVSIYINGPENRVIDLNLVPDGLSDGSDFDVDAAIAKHGKLEDVAPFSLTIGQLLSDNAQIFRKQCKELVDDIESTWKPMDSMSENLGTDGNAIENLNNYVLNNLRATRYAKICTKLST